MKLVVGIIKRFRRINYLEQVPGSDTTRIPAITIVSDTVYVRNPKDQQEEEVGEGGVAVAAAVATTTAVAEEKDCLRIYYSSSCSCQRRKTSPKSILYGVDIIF